MKMSWATCVLIGATTLWAASASPAEPPAGALDHWLVLGPIPVSSEGTSPPDKAAQKKAFETDILAPCGGETQVRALPPPPCLVAGRELGWKAVDASDGIVDLVKGIGASDYAVAYALIDVEAPTARRVLLGLGSDDAITAWLNGALVHSNWVMRPVGKDQDLVSVDLKAGRNQLLLKIQNGAQDWAFAARSLDAPAQEEAIWRAARRGDLDTMRTILSQGHGLNLDARPKCGLTPWQIARICGRADAAELLASKGAAVNLAFPPPEAVVDAMFLEPTSGKTPGAAVLVSRNGKTIFEKGYGYASIENDVRVTPETRFRIGSITKQFTAAAILRLQERGKLSIDDHLSKFIPGYPRGGEVTLRHLLTHTSGIHSFTDKPDFLETVTTPIKSADDFIRSFENDPYDFTPGTRWSYDNSGYFLLGSIVEKVSGQPYGEFLRAQFFEPLGMKDTGVYRNADPPAYDSTGYSQDGASVKKARNWDMSRAGGAGILYSTVGDLARWNEGLFDGRALSKASLDAAWTPVSTTSPQEPTKEGYGFGWLVDTFRGLREIHHGGGLDGFLSELTRFPVQGLTVVVLANAAPPVPGLVPSELAHDVAEIYLGDAMETRPSTRAVTLAPADLEAFVGRYDYGSAILAVTREGDHLFAQLSGQARFEIFPRSANEFFWKVVDAQITFVRDASGHVVKARHHQGGSSLDAPRIEEQDSISMDPAALDAYVGKYDYGQGKVILTVTREGTRLFAQMTGQPKFEIFASSPTDFFWKVVNARVTFVKDAAGRVTKAIHQQAGHTMEAPRIE
jgi:CubicO group peptidase (beta-lactamase class C family)